VLYIFLGHLRDDTKEVFAETKINLAVISGNHTLCLQPLDVPVNKPFKDMSKLCTVSEWQVEGN
jgi:hypothetical protein